MKTAPYGTWSTPISSSTLVAGTIGLSSPTFCQGQLLWHESRPEDAGRTRVVALDSNGVEKDLTPGDWNIRSMVHEYGGSASRITSGDLFFVNFSDQQIYRRDLSEDKTEVIQVTRTDGLRFADFILDEARDRLISVIEDHRNAAEEAANFLGAVDLKTGAVSSLHEGRDFYSNPGLMHDRLVWTCWDHPNMPWDGTELWQAGIGSEGELSRPEKIAGGTEVSITQPCLSENDDIFYVSDENGWWNLYCHQNGVSRCLLEQQAEFGLPQWAFGQTSYQILDENHLICTWSVNNVDNLGLLNFNSGQLTHFDLPFTSISDLALDASGRKTAFIGASPTAFPAIYLFDIDSGEIECIKQSSNLNLDPGYYSQPETLTFPTGPHARSTDGIAGEIAHGFYYPPANKDFEAPDGELPPLLVILHGGPTASTHATLNLKIQYWTSRGVGVLDVNYRGSTGYGRAYREKLNNNWGITDVEDACAGAQYLCKTGKADENRLLIRGGSAGGFTTLAALATTDTFSAGASYYGIGDLLLLAEDTHKFESRYLNSLIGPYPEAEAVYRERSPLNHVEGFNCPVIFFQGDEDKVVPPNQAETMVSALKDKGLPVAYVLFEGEQHGFRRAENIKRALDLEFWFYARIFGYEPADAITPVTIENMD